MPPMGQPVDASPARESGCQAGCGAGYWTAHHEHQPLRGLGMRAVREFLLAVSVTTGGLLPAADRTAVPSPADQDRAQATIRTRGTACPATAPTGPRPSG